MRITESDLLQAGRWLRPLDVEPFDKGTLAQITGLLSRVVTIDIDYVPEDGVTRAFAHRRTPRGFHIDVVAPRPAVSLRYPGMDLLGDGRCAVVLGSKNGVGYQWLRDPRPWNLDELPDRLRSLLVGVACKPTEFEIW